MSLTHTKEIQLCDPYVWEDPRYLFRSTWLDKYLNRRRGVCKSELVNEILFVYLFSLLAGFLASVFTGVKSATLFAALAATIYLIPVFLKLHTIDSFKSAVESVESKEPHEPYVQENLKESFTNSSDPQPEPSSILNAKNPFQNVLIDELKYEPNRGPAPDITSQESKVALDEFFRVQWFSDPTDIYGKTQSQRMFVSQPSTTIPNDQDSYQKWLYKIPGKTCKEGNPEACYGGTNGAAPPWLNM
jgi:hypothetical protein